MSHYSKWSLETLVVLTMLSFYRNNHFIFKSPPLIKFCILNIQLHLHSIHLIILGSKHSGKRSLIDSLFDISKTTFHNKRVSGQNDNKMRLKGLTTAIDYAYLNVIDINDPDNSNPSIQYRNTYQIINLYGRRS